MAIQKGKLVRWIDDKGFGFIRSENANHEIFIHISALKEMSRKPIVGDLIRYQIGFDSNGKTRAVDASIEGVSPALTLQAIDNKQNSISSAQKTERTNKKQRINSHRNNKSYSFYPISLCLVLALIVYFYNSKNYSVAQNVEVPMVGIQSMAQVEQFQCTGKVWCSQMISYEEAEFYLRNCPGTNMDGDGDGVPCERQFNKW